MSTKNIKIIEGYVWMMRLLDHNLRNLRVIKLELLLRG